MKLFLLTVSIRWFVRFATVHIFCEINCAKLALVRLSGLIRIGWLVRLDISSEGAEIACADDGCLVRLSRFLGLKLFGSFL